MPKILSRSAGLGALGLVALAMFAYAPDKPRAELEAAYPGEYRAIDGVRLRLRDTGPRGAPVVILLHGFCASLDTWEPWARALSTRYRVIRYDLPGFGLTGPDPTGDYSDARQMKILADLMDQLGVKRASLVGNSMGGRIVWNFAARHPDRVTRMVLVSPDGFASPGFAYDHPPETPLIMRALPYVAPREHAEGRSGRRLRARGGLERDDPDPLPRSPARARRQAGDRGAHGSGDPARSRPDAGADQGPDAPASGARRTASSRSATRPRYLRDLPQATLVRLPNLGHVPFEEDPVASLTPLKVFLSGETP